MVLNVSEDKNVWYVDRDAMKEFIQSAEDRIMKKLAQEIRMSERDLMKTMQSYMRDVEKLIKESEDRMRKESFKICEHIVCHVLDQMIKKARE